MTAPLLPPVADAPAWDALRVPDAVYAAAVAAVGARHGFDVSHSARSPRGTSPVFLTDDRAVKLIPPPWAHELAREVAALERVHNRLPARTPAVLATGALDDWRYLVTERLPGVSLREVAQTLSPAARVAVAAQTGEVLAALHAVPCDGLAALTPDWNSFADERAAACVAFQRQYRLAEAAVAEIPAMLARAAPWVPDDRRALLHADLHHEHVLLTPRGDTWNVTGVIDFGDVVVGHPEYDLVTPVFFVARDDRDALRALFAGAGFRCDEAASRRMMAWSTMHRYNALARFLPADHGADALEALRARYWPVTA